MAMVIVDFTFPTGVYADLKGRGAVKIHTYIVIWGEICCIIWTNELSKESMLYAYIQKIILPLMMSVRTSINDKWSLMHMHAYKFDGHLQIHMFFLKWTKTIVNGAQLYMGDHTKLPSQRHGPCDEEYRGTV